jgi:hypothetical protein
LLPIFYLLALLLSAHLEKIMELGKSTNLPFHWIEAQHKSLCCESGILHKGVRRSSQIQESQTEKINFVLIHLSNFFFQVIQANDQF